MRYRPTGVMIIAIIGILYGLLGCLCNNPLSAVAALIPTDEVISTGFPMLDQSMAAQQNQPQGVKVLNFATAMIGWVLSILLVVGAIGAIMMKRWGRTCLMWWAYIYLANVVIWSLVFSISTAPQAAAMSAEMSGGGPTMPTGFFVGLYLCCSSIFLLYPIATILYLAKQDVKQAFDSEGMGGGGGWGGPPPQAPWGQQPYGPPPQHNPYGYQPQPPGAWQQPDPNYPPNQPPPLPGPQPPQYGAPPAGPPTYHPNDPYAPPPQGYEPEGTPDTFEEDEDERR